MVPSGWRKGNTFTVDGDIVYVDIRKDEDIVAVTKVDADLWPELSESTWTLVGKGYVASHGRGGQGGLKYLHRVVADTHGTKWWTDHKNGDKLDNRKANLRAVNASQSQINKKTKRGELRNIYPDSRTGEWTVRLVKTFKNLEEAKLWRDKTTELVFGLDFLSECFNRD